MTTPAESQPRYVYALHEQCNRPGADLDPDFELVEQAEVTVAGNDLDVPAGRLTGWSLDVLRAKHRRTGIYSAEFSMANSDGDPDSCVREINLCWLESEAAMTIWPGCAG